jgi:hypothetical protein
VWLLQLFESRVCVHSAANMVNLSSDSLMKNISDTKKYIQDLSQEVAEIKKVLRTEPPIVESYGKLTRQR